jgi:hypothetical protein
MKRSITMVAMVVLVSTSGFPAIDLDARGRALAGAQRPKAEMTRVPQFDNPRATSWKSIIPPHTESTLHRHDRFRTVIGIVGGNLTTVDPSGRKTVTRYETGKAYWQEPMPPGAMHKDVNETDKTIELTVVELK